MRKSLACLLTLLSAAFAFAETPISEPHFARGAGNQSWPVSATDGRDFLLAWTDTRRGEAAVYATRIAADGSVLDREGILVSSPDRTAYAPRAAWTGSGYAIVWTGPEGSEFRRLASDGTFIDESPRRVFDEYTVMPRVAVSNGTILVAAVKSYRGVEIAVIDDTGRARRVSEIRGWSSVELACTASECLAVQQTYGRSIVGRRIGRDGAVLEASDRVLAVHAKGVAIASNGDRLMLAWLDLRSVMSQDVAGPPLPPSRKLWARELGSEAFVVAETTKGQIYDAAVAQSGNGFIVSWTQDREREWIDRLPRVGVEETATARTAQFEIRARVVGSDRDDALTIAASNVVRDPRPSVASNGATHFGAWIESVGFGKIAAGVSQEGRSLSRIAVTRTATQQTDEQLIASGEHLLVVWSEALEGDGTFAIFARRFRSNGEAMNAGPIRIASSTRSQRTPVAAFDGSSYLIAWAENDAVHARVLDRDGVLASDVMTLSNAAGGTPSITATDRGFAVLHGVRGADGRPQLAITRVAHGSTLGRTELGSWSDKRNGIGWNGEEIVAVWSAPDHRILAARLTADGLRLDGEPIIVGRGALHLMEDASIACAASECAIAWWNLVAGVQAARLVGGSAFAIDESFRDFTDYRQPPSDRFEPVVLRAGTVFQFITSGPGGVLYSRTVRDAIASAETIIFQPRARGENRGSIAYTPNGLMRVYSRPVDTPRYGGARRLFLGTLSD
ncbi:MAG TPA: hypothetical protein VEK79_01405 [Thermoanaerobaculia bacterium]|nr:hypothetical protein [Thermoanaerobaculia bacterium]